MAWNFLNFLAHCDRETVLHGKKFVLEDMEKRGNILDTHNHDLNEGVLLSRCGLGCVPYLEGQNDVTHHPLVQDVLENSKLREFFEKYFFGQPALTFDFKWLRVMPREKFTGVHVDNVYMSRHSIRPENLKKVQTKKKTREIK